MGDWAKELFGREEFEPVGIVVAGTNPVEFEKKILGCFDEVISSKDSVYHAHLVKKDGKYYPIVFNVYGAPAMVDVLTEMHDGGCRNFIFVGYAFGFAQGLDVGDVVLAKEAHHFDGIYSHVDPSRELAQSDKELFDTVKKILSDAGIEHQEGVDISVPAVTFQPPHANEKYAEIKPTTIEMEVAAFYSRAKDIGARATAVLVISDTRAKSIHGGEEHRVDRAAQKEKVLQAVIGVISGVQLEPLPVEKEFQVDDHLASIVEHPDDITNVYKDKK